MKVEEKRGQRAIVLQDDCLPLSALQRWDWKRAVGYEMATK